MQTTLKHEKNEILVYVGLGASKALLLYPFWLFKSKGTKSTTAFGGFKTPRGWGWHLGLFGVQVFGTPKGPTISVKKSYAEFRKGLEDLGRGPETKASIREFQCPVLEDEMGKKYFVDPVSGERVYRDSLPD